MTESSQNDPHGVLRPRRTRISRRKGHRALEPGSVKVDRSTRWGNPFKPTLLSPLQGTKLVDGRVRPMGFLPRDNAEAVALYRLWLDGTIVLADRTAPTVAEIRDALRGHDLACWCLIGAVCHVDVLLEVANG